MDTAYTVFMIITLFFAAAGLVYCLNGLSGWLLRENSRQGYTIVLHARDSWERLEYILRSLDRGYRPSVGRVVLLVDDEEKRDRQDFLNALCSQFPYVVYCTENQLGTAIRSEQGDNSP